MTGIIKVDTIQNNGGTTGLTIDSSGHVSRPVVPSFLISVSSDYSHTNGNTIQYNETSSIGHNTGGHWDTTNYIFVAPLAGTYYFHARVSFATGEKTRRADIRLELNGSSSDSDYSARGNLDGTNTGGSSYLALNGSWIVNLSANDEVSFDTNWETDGTFDATETIFNHGSYVTGYFIG